MKGKKIVLKHKKNDLKKLVMLMNQQNKRDIPPLAPLIHTLDFVLAEGELDLLLRLGTATYSHDQALVASGMSVDKFAPMFESLKQKGFIGLVGYDTGEERHSLNPVMTGWYESQVSFMIGKPEEKEFSRRFMALYPYLRNRNFFPLRNLTNLIARKEPVSNQSIGVVDEYKDEKGKSIVNIGRAVDIQDSKVYPTNTVNDLIHEYGTKSVIGQFICMCRRLKRNLDDPCSLGMPDEDGCMAFGEVVKPYIKYGLAKRISKEQAFDVIQRTRDNGAIHSVYHEMDDTNMPQVGLCNCCWDCCGILGAYNMGAIPLRYSSFYMARMADGSKCNGCKKCEKYCPTAAITVENKQASIDSRKCIGCGQCVHQCASAAVALVENKRTVFLPMLKRSQARIKV
ncbi:MAG: 4Fe-4S binding protein [Candidatus Hodarchaeota archaeon]